MNLQIKQLQARLDASKKRRASFPDIVANSDDNSFPDTSAKSDEYFVDPPNSIKGIKCKRQKC